MDMMIWLRPSDITLKGKATMAPWTWQEMSGNGQQIGIVTSIILILPTKIQKDLKSEVGASFAEDLGLIILIGVLPPLDFNSTLFQECPSLVSASLNLWIQSSKSKNHDEINNRNRWYFVKRLKSALVLLLVCCCVLGCEKEDQEKTAPIK